MMGNKVKIPAHTKKPVDWLKTRKKDSSKRTIQQMWARWRQDKMLYQSRTTAQSPGFILGSTRPLPSLVLAGVYSSSSAEQSRILETRRLELTPPQMPDDNGRILRTGNIFSDERDVLEVTVDDYLTEDTRRYKYGPMHPPAEAGTAFPASLQTQLLSQDDVEKIENKLKEIVKKNTNRYRTAGFVRDQERFDRFASTLNGKGAKLMTCMLACGLKYLEADQPGLATCYFTYIDH